MQAAIMDTYIRELYKHSELYDDIKEPTVDLSHTDIAENKKPIEFDEDSELNLKSLEPLNWVKR